MRCYSLISPRIQNWLFLTLWLSPASTVAECGVAELQTLKGVVMTRMIQIATLLFFLVILGSLSLAQNPSQQPGTGNPMDQKSQSSGMGMHDMSKMHEQMMNDMQADRDSMRSNLQKMKDQIGKVSDRGTKDQLQLNIDMWQSLIAHMDKHMAAMKKMMSAHGGPPTDGTKHEHEHAPATPKQ
jgi:hypothetical protein